MGKFLKFIPLWLMVASWVCATVSGTSIAQESDTAAVKARLAEVAKSYTKDNAFMGSVLVARGDQVLLDKGYGMADVEWGIPDAPDVKFRLGSLTKQFTAVLVLLLQQDNKLRIEEPASKYLPDLPKSWVSITLAELLGHTSGIPDFTGDKDFGSWRMSPHTTTEKIAFFRDKPLDFEPGSKFQYSNSNYEVLGAVIERVSGKSYGDLLHERIFQPLEMNDSGLDTDELILPKRAEGYRPNKGAVVHVRSESMTIPWAAGSIYSTTGDLLRWEQGLFSAKILSEDSLKLMTTPGMGGYGLGVEVSGRNGLEVVEHNGGIEGFNTYLAYVPERRIAVVVLSNVNGGVPATMGPQLVDITLGKPVVLATERKTVPISKQEVAKFEGTFELSPSVKITFAAEGDALTLKVGGRTLPLSYEGVRDGHPWFYVLMANAEIEFIPDATGAMTSLVSHQNGHDQPGKLEPFGQHEPNP